MTTIETKPAAANLIDGQWGPGSGSDAIEIFNPATGEKLADLLPATIEDAEAAVAAATRAFVEWGARPLGERVRILYRMKTILEENAENDHTRPG